MATAPRTIRIANAGGYWGDDPDAWNRQVKGSRVDYITADYLAETTMSILKKQHRAEPTLGYAHDFVKQVLGVLPDLMKAGTRVVVNAGGVNPIGCAAALMAGAKAAGLVPRVALVLGDDILNDIGRLRATGVGFSHLDTGQSFAAIAPRLVAANAYLGAAGIASALGAGAQIVVTGRVADAALTLGPLVHEFGWAWTDWDKLAAGTVAGHLIECGAQVTGGNFTDWRQVKSFANIGFPIVEVEESGEFVLTKPPGTGGLVNRATVLEQLFYEVGDPTAYVTPDVVADFTRLAVTEQGADRVRISGAKGGPATPFYKVSMAYDAGFKVSGGVIVSGPDARAKGQSYADLVWSRCSGLDQTLTEFVGQGALHGALGALSGDEEVWLRFTARSREKGPLGQLAKLIPALILSGPPGITFTGGISKPQEVIGFWPALVPKAEVKPRFAWYDGSLGELTPVEVLLAGTVERGRVSSPAPGADYTELAAASIQSAFAERHAQDARPLSDWCLVRSGDKGDKLNLAVIARGAAEYAFLKEALTAQKVKDWFQELALGSVTRYPIDGLHTLNFVLEQALGGGGLVSLRLDALGKSLGAALLRQRLSPSG